MHPQVPISERSTPSPAGFEHANCFADEIVPYVPELRRRANKLAGDPVLADDIVQETCERALRFGNQFEKGTNLRAWLMQVLFSVFVSGFRRTSRERSALKRLALDPCAWTNEPRYVAPDQELSMTPCTRDVLASIPSTFRRVIELVDLEDLTYREAADELGLPLGTVMSRLHRGRKLLGSQLQAAA